MKTHFWIVHVTSYPNPVPVLSLPQVSLLGGAWGIERCTLGGLLVLRTLRYSCGPLKLNSRSQLQTINLFTLYIHQV